MLGSLLDTDEDIKRRKGLAIDAVRNQKNVFRSKKLTAKTKAKLFLSFIDSIFLYNSEIWTLTKTQESKIDSFQRRLLRTHVLNVHYPKIVKNEDVYKLTNHRPWSDKIKTRRLNWFGHLVRLHMDTPAQKAYRHCQKPMKRGRGHPKLLWTKMMENQLLNDLELSLIEAENIAKNRKSWRALVWRAQCSRGYGTAA